MSAPASALARVPEFEVVLGDCVEVLRTLATASVDAVVTDPPYELGFMNKKWDASGIAYSVELWREVLRVLKPGGHLLAFGGTRTYHRMACAIEDAGFEIRDSILWLYGTGFPKSLNVSKAIEDAGDSAILAPDGKLAAASVWSGWGTALKPAHEPIVMARKPLEGTVAANVLAHGTGALNIDACRIATTDDRSRPPRTPNAIYGNGKGTNLDASESHPAGRWPANVVLDEGAAAELDAQSGVSKSPGKTGRGGSSSARSMEGGELRAQGVVSCPDDSGGASRFFYVAKASRAEREIGCDHLPRKSAGEATDREDGSAGLSSPRAGAGRTSGARNHHPTVKPIALMRHLVRLVTPAGGVVLDPFCGSGSTGCAAVLEGFDFLGIEREAEYVAIANARITHHMSKGSK